MCVSVCVYLVLYVLYSPLLSVYLVSQVQRHTLQVDQDAADVGQVVLHLLLPGVPRHPGVGGEGEGESVCVCVCVCVTAN